MCYEIKENKLILHLRIIPSSSKNEIKEKINGRLKIKIKAPPEKGKANKELIKFLSKLLKIKKNEIEIIKGKTSQDKTLSLPTHVMGELKKYI